MALTIETNRALKHLLVSFSCHELNIENLRQELAVYEQFTLYGCFRRIVANKKQRLLTVSALKSFLHENQFEWVDEKDAALLFREFTQRDDETNLDFQEFTKIFLPQDSQELRSELSQREPTDKKVYMPLPIE